MAEGDDDDESETPGRFAGSVQLGSDLLAWDVAAVSKFRKEFGFDEFGWDGERAWR